MKIVIRLFTFFLLIAALILIFVVVSRWEEKKNPSHQKTSAAKIVSVNT